MAARPLVRTAAPALAAMAAMAAITLALVPLRGAPPGPAKRAPAAGGAIFSERAAELGIDFVHANGMSGKTYMVEIMGPGIALLDYDNDGDLDLYVVQGGPLPPAAGAPGRAATDRLFRNDLAETGRLHFTDVTGAAGIAALGSMGYGQGVATGDVDGDGWVDVLRTGFGHARLLLNTGKGTFVDATARAGVDDPRWTTSATFFDYDRDGRLDLFVARYVDLSLAAAASHPCRSDAGFVDYCGPLSYRPLPSRLFHNRGGGVFEDVSARSGIAARPGNGLGVVADDLDGDGWPDLYVANDGIPNHLWVNRKNGTFAEQAVEAGCAVNGEGSATASMGLAAADFDGDGHDDLFITNLTGETDTLFLGDGRGDFADSTLAAGLAAPSLPFTSFGTLDLDYDNDGWPDLLVANGAIHKIEAQLRAGDPLPLRQRAQLLHNLGRGRFAEVTGPALGALAGERVRRGAAFGDLDNDGDTDVVVADNNGRLEVLINEVGQRNRWLGLRLTGGTPPRDMLGARVEATLADGRVLARHAHTDGSYLSANDPRVLFGLGPAGSVRELRVTWPDGRRERFAGPAPGRYATLRQGTGAALPAAAGAPK